MKKQIAYNYCKVMYLYEAQVAQLNVPMQNPNINAETLWQEIL